MCQWIYITNLKQAWQNIVQDVGVLNNGKLIHMKTYSYRILGTSIIEDTKFTNLVKVREHILGFYGECKIEYWGRSSGTMKIFKK